MEFIGLRILCSAYLQTNGGDHDSLNLAYHMVESANDLVCWGACLYSLITEWGLQNCNKSSIGGEEAGFKGLLRTKKFRSFLLWLICHQLGTSMKP